MNKFSSRILRESDERPVEIREKNYLDNVEMVKDQQDAFDRDLLENYDLTPASV